MLNSARKQIDLTPYYWRFIGFIYLFLSIVGTLLISDEFDSVKLNIFAFLAVPVLSFGILIFWQMPRVYAYLLPYKNAYLVLGFFILAPGVLAAINAFGSLEKVRYQRTLIEDQEFAALRQAGMFGVPFHFRQF